MKRLTLKSLTIIMLLVLLSACGVPNEDHEALLEVKDNLQTSYDVLLAEKDNLQSNYDMLLAEKDKLQSDYETQKSEYDKLAADTADWLKLTDDQKAAQLAQAEADKIAAEKAAKEAAEAKAAAEAKEKEEAEKKAAEEAAKKAEEEKKGYNTGITFDQLARNPDEYKGDKVKFKGEVLQVTEIGSEIQIRLATKSNSWGGYSDNVIYIFFNETLISSRILEEDIITIYGVSKGLHTYTTVMGAEVTLPLVEVDKIDY